MGQRFQIIINREGYFSVYHVQWLWGDYVIRRIGTAVRNYMLYNKDNLLSFDKFLYGSFYGKPNDMNSIKRYFKTQNYCDNKEMLKVYKSKKKVILHKSRKLFNCIKDFDNDDGYFYIEITDERIKGYCFITNDLNVCSAMEYTKNYKRTEGFTKKQEREYEKGLKTFSKLGLLNPKKVVVKNRLI